VFVTINKNLDTIVAGDDISIVIHPDWWAPPTTVGYSISIAAPVQRTIASYVLPTTLEYDWTVDVVAEITAPEEGELMAAGSQYTFRWTQKPPNPTSYRLRFSTDDAQTFPELGNGFPGNVDPIARTVPATPTTEGLVRLEGIFPQFDPIFNPPIPVTTTDEPVLHVGTPTAWHVGENGTVNWTVSGNVEHFKAELSRNGGQSWTTLADNVPGTQHHLTVGVDLPLSTHCHVRVTAVGPNGTVSATTGVFHIVGGPPHRGDRTPRD